MKDQGSRRKKNNEGRKWRFVFKKKRNGRGQGESLWFLAVLSLALIELTGDRIMHVAV